MGGSIRSDGSNSNKQQRVPPSREWLLASVVFKSLTMLVLAVGFLMGLVHGFAVDYLRTDYDRFRSDSD